MEKITLINTGSDVWPVTVKLGTDSVALSVPINSQFSLFASEVEHSSTFQEIGGTTQYLRGDEPRKIVTEIESPALAAYMLLGAFVALHVFSFINPFKTTGT